MFELLLTDFRGHLQTFLAVVLCLLAFAKGGKPEQIFAVTWLLLFEISSTGYRQFVSGGNQLVEVDLFLASMDLIAGIIWVWLALNANRNYTLWIAGMQLLAIMAHVARALSETISPIAYLTMFVAPGWLQLLFFAIGLSRHIQRKRGFGDYRDWRIAKGPDKLNMVPLYSSLNARAQSNRQDGAN